MLADLYSKISNLDSKISAVEGKIPDTSNFVTKNHTHNISY
jgi:hypothetical protein